MASLSSRLFLSARHRFDWLANQHGVVARRGTPRERNSSSWVSVHAQSRSLASTMSEPEKPRTRSHERADMSDTDLEIVVTADLINQRVVPSTCPVLQDTSLWAPQLMCASWARAQPSSFASPRAESHAWLRVVMLVPYEPSAIRARAIFVFLRRTAFPRRGPVSQGWWRDLELETYISLFIETFFETSF